MKIKLFATFRQLTGETEREVIAAATIEELLEMLCQRYGEKFRQEIFVNGRLSDFVLILVNGRAIEHLNGLQTKLEADDQIAIFPKVAGG